MTDVLKLFDQYNRRARLFPALLAFLPPLFLVVAWFPVLLTDISGKSLLVVFCSMGGLYLLASLSRSAGKKTEKRLLKKWGGWPTTLWLRHRDSHLVASTKARYHDYLGHNVPGITFPTVHDEDAKPSIADQTYASAIEWLKEKRRGEKYPLVLDENIEYGFRRNMRGLKWFSIGLCFAAPISVIGSVWLRFGTIKGSLLDKSPIEQLSIIVSVVSVPVIAALVVNVVALLFWLFYVRDAWVREAGDQYARALLATCE